MAMFFISNGERTVICAFFPVSRNKTLKVLKAEVLAKIGSMDHADFRAFLQCSVAIKAIKKSVTIPGCS